MKSVRWLVSYILVAVLGLWLAFAMSAKFMAPAYSQNAPSNGDLPPEFLKEVESTAAPNQAPQKVPVPPPAPPPGKQIPAATAKAPTPPVKTNGQAKQQPTVPPPPTNQIPKEEGVNNASPSADVITVDDYKYDPTGKRDPFKVFRAVKPIIKTDSKVATEVAEPLQRFELDRLQVIAILWDVRVPRAMVRDPDGGLYTIVKNSKIGRNDGYVAAIREGEVVVVETIFFDGQPTKETRVMELKK
ncbi:MAG: pilus assembly protein PilP [Bdellovibrio sp.]